MNIRFDNNPIGTIPFCNIYEGKCFVIDYNTPNQTICMKTYCGDIEGNVNAVDLQTGENYVIEKDVRVVPLDAELKVWLLDD